MFEDLNEEQVLKNLRTSLQSGLTESAVSALRSKYGWNYTQNSYETNSSPLILKQFKDKMVIALIIALVISLIHACFDEQKNSFGLIEPLTILAIIAMNSIITARQNSNAKTYLSDLQSEHISVLRDSNWKPILVKELVPGDVIELNEGSRSPATVRVVKLLSPKLMVDQSMLNEEEELVSKYSGASEGSEMGKRNNIVYVSSYVSIGSAICVVIETDMKTVINDFGLLLQPIVQEESTSFKNILEKLSMQFIIIIIVIFLIVWITNYGKFSDEIHRSFFRGALYYFSISLALAVAIIPEGLSVVFITSLALSNKRLLKRNLRIKRQSSVENSGLASFMCIDKDILTTNEMTANNFYLLAENDLEKFTVTGHSYDSTKGEVEGLSENHYNEVLK